MFWNMTTILAKDEHDLAEHDRDSGLVILERDCDTCWTSRVASSCSEASGTAASITMQPMAPQCCIGKPPANAHGQVLKDRHS